MLSFFQNNTLITLHHLSTLGCLHLQYTGTNTQLHNCPIFLFLCRQRNSIKPPNIEVGGAVTVLCVFAFSWIMSSTQRCNESYSKYTAISSHVVPALAQTLELFGSLTHIITAICDFA